MEVFTFMLKLIKPYKKGPTLPVGQKTLWAPLQRMLAKQRTVPVQVIVLWISSFTAHHLT
jgi:hypothetical protein